jgi:UDP-N-acetylglucosamine 3-dehydrogenase
MTDAAVKLGLTGFGWFAELLAERVFPFVPEVRIVGVCDQSPRRRERAAELLGVPVFEDMDALLQGSDCEAVSILTPHNTHRKLVEAAAGMGRHIFSEKAMAVTVADCVAMIRAADAANVVLMVGHMQKLFPPYARVIEIVRSGIYGRPLAVNVFGFHWCPVFEGWWRKKEACGGLLYWTGIHDLDTMRAIIGEEVNEVYAAAGPKTDSYTEYEDSISVTLKYEGGAIGTLQVAEHDPLREFNDSFALSVLCERGSIRYLPENPAVEHRSRNGHDVGELHREPFPKHEDNENAAYRWEFAHFARVVRGKESPVLTAEDGLRCIETLQAIYQSLSAGIPTKVSRGRTE